MKEFSKVSKSLLGLSKEMRDTVCMPSHIKLISGDLHVALMMACVEALAWRDPTVVLDMLLGMPVLDCPDSGCHRLKEQPAVTPVTPEANLRLNKRSIRQACRLGRRCATDGEVLLQSMAVWGKTLEEEKLGFICRSSERDLNSKYGHGGWRCMNRFGVWQDGKWRCCDNAAASGHNEATHLRETICCVDCDFPAAAAVAFARKGLFDCKLSTDDISMAYRKVGNAQPMFTVFVVWDPVSARHVFF